jgi:hypothetical protein
MWKRSCRLCRRRHNAPLPAAVYNNFITTAPGENSGVPVRVSYDGFFHLGYRKISIRKNLRPPDRFLWPARAPFGAELQQDLGRRKESTGEKKKPTRILIGSLFDGPKKKRKEKTSQTARRA